MQGHEEYLNKGGVATFSRLKFVVGTGCKMVNIKFRVPVKCNGKQMTVESSQSEPFIVMTNTKQWDEAQGILLKKDIFRGRLEVTSPQFCNTIQRHYMQASRQDSLKAVRPLGPTDFDFLFSTKIVKNFGLSELLSHKDFDRFWLWFGPALQKIRYHKYLIQMWTAGLFWGFISKSESEHVLEPYGMGTFLLRFSERMSDGSMAVAYKQKQNEVRHYLIRAKDISGQGRSLPQFIRETRSLLHFLRITFSDSFVMNLHLIDKHKALEKIGKKKKPVNNNGDGYDPELLELGLDSLTV